MRPINLSILMILLLPLAALGQTSLSLEAEPTSPVLSEEATTTLSAPITPPAPTLPEFRYPVPLPTDPDAISLGGWKLDTTVSAPASGASLQTVPNRAEQGALALNGTLPAGIIRSVREEERRAWAKGHSLKARVFVAPPATRSSDPRVSAQLVAFHEQWGGFLAHPARPLALGKWTEVCWLLGQESPDWEPMASNVAWNDTLRRRLSQIGLRFYSNSSTPLSIRVADIRVDGLTAPEPPLRVADRTSEALLGGAKRGKRVELTFDLSRAYDNPFDPDCVAVDVEYDTPSASSPTISLPAFYWQDYTRQRLSDGSELCRPRGRACWKARFMPRDAGPHAYRIRVSDGRTSETFTTESRAFTVADAPFRGFLRVDPDDARYMSFDDGSFFYPISLIVRCPFDTRCTHPYSFEPLRGQGTYVYDRVFKRMAENKTNFTRVWMASWWVGLEWTRGVREDFAGLGRYSQMSAWQLDHVLELAERHGIYVDLTLQNHGMFSGNHDSEWQDNPYNRVNGGPIRSATLYWSDETSREYIRKRQRYVVARWAAFPAVGWWELSSEIDLVDQYRAYKEDIYEWHRVVARHLRSIDPYGRPITTHYIGQRFDPDMFDLEEMEIVQANGYELNMARSVQKMWDRYEETPAGKPRMIDEFGVGRTPQMHRYNLHSGLWASSVMPFCGAAMFWYFQYVDGADEYDQFRATAAFHEGEDYRGRNFEPMNDLGIEAEEEAVECVAMRNEEALRVWLYDEQIYRGLTDPEIRDFAPVTLRAPDMRPGRYRVEFWDTWKGEPIADATSEYDHTTGTLEFVSPEFSRDIACKVERIGDAKNPDNEKMGE